MAQLSWNFSSGNRIRFAWLIVVVPAFLACIHALVWRQYLIEERDHAIADISEVSRRLTFRKSVVPTTPRDLSSVFLEMRFPWMDMLNSLKRATPREVRLLSVEPDGSPARRIRINGTARRAQDLIELVEALQMDHAWSDIKLINQTNTNEKMTSKTSGADIPTLPGLAPAAVSFSLTAEWSRS